MDFTEKTKEKERIPYNSDIIDLFEKSKEYYCIKFKIIGFENKLFVIGILFFEIPPKNVNQIYRASFINNPKLLFTRFHSVLDKIHIDDSWLDFYNLIKQNMDQTYKSYFSFYVQVLKKIMSQYYKNDFETKRAPGRDMQERKHLLFELKNNVYNFLVKLWSLYKSQVQVDFERVNHTLLKHFKDELKKDKEAQEKIEELKKNDIDWELNKDIPINRYLPVISIEHGEVAKDLKPDSKVFVCDYEDEEGLPHFPYTDRPEYEREIVKVKLGKNHCMRVLVKDENGNYGDVEVFDTLLKVKTNNVNKSIALNKKPKHKIFSTKFWLFFNFFVTILFLTTIYIFIRNNFI